MTSHEAQPVSAWHFTAITRLARYNRRLWHTLGNRPAGMEDERTLFHCSLFLMAHLIIGKNWKRTLGLGLIQVRQERTLRYNSSHVLLTLSAKTEDLAHAFLLCKCIYLLTDHKAYTFKGAAHTRKASVHKTRQLPWKSLSSWAGWLPSPTSQKDLPLRTTKIATFKTSKALDEKGCIFEKLRKEGYRVQEEGNQPPGWKQNEGKTGQGRAEVHGAGPEVRINQAQARQQRWGWTPF